MTTDQDAIQKKQSITRGYLLVVGMSIFWGVSWPIMKIALLEIPPWTFRTISLACGGVGILILAKISGQKLSIPKNEFMPLLLVSMLNVTGWHLGSAHGISHMQAGRAVIVGFTMPLWATIASSLILGEKVTVQKILGLLLGLTGLFILLQPQLVAVGDKPLGIFFMLGGAISWGTGTVLLKYFKWTMPTVLLTGWQLMIGSLPVIAGTILLEPSPAISQLSLNAVLAMLYVIVFPMLFCHWAWFTVVGIFPASVAAISTLAIPVVGVLSSAVVLGESLGVREGTALVLVITAMGIVLLWRR
jgi:drug/metabolite transporter (DMT)-like permease